MEEKYPHPKLTPKQWIENFWYYHKWLFLTVLVFVTFILIATVQMFLKVDPDISFLYVGPKTLGEDDCENIALSSEAFFIDSNGDGEIKSNILTFTLSSDYDELTQGMREQALQEFQGYSDEILSGDATILLLDPYFYEQLAEQGALITLFDVFEEMPSSAVDYCGLELKKTPFAKLPGFSSLPEDTIVCLKIAPVGGEIGLEEQLEIDENTIKQFLALYEGSSAGAQ